MFAKLDITSVINKARIMILTDSEFYYATQNILLAISKNTNELEQRLANFCETRVVCVSSVEGCIYDSIEKIRCGFIDRKRFIVKKL